MKREKLKDRALPSYTKAEEIMNMVSHIVGGALAIAALVLCVVMAAVNGNVWGVVSGAIYGGAMIVLYCMSSIYHGLRPSTPKKVMRIIDHCSIYLLIAGTYTPLTIGGAFRVNSPGVAWTLFGIVWGFAALGITLNSIDMKKFQVFSMICYIGMGWCVVFAIRPLLDAIPWPAFWLLIAGGLAYTVGSVLYGVGKRVRYMHSVFHLFVLAGSILQFFCILSYVMRYRE